MGRGARCPGMDWPGLGVPYGAGSGCRWAVLVEQGGGTDGRAGWSLRRSRDGRWPVLLALVLVLVWIGQGEQSPTAVVMVGVGSGSVDHQNNWGRRLRRPATGTVTETATKVKWQQFCASRLCCCRPGACSWSWSWRSCCCCCCCCFCCCIGIASMAGRAGVLCVCVSVCPCV